MGETEYRPRLIDSKLELYMRTFGAILIYGPKLTGKTTTGERHSASVVRILDASNNFSTRKLAKVNPQYVLDNQARPTLIDEWQEVPPIWDAVRAECDKSKEKGQFILTGSNFPMDSENRPVHSGAGRIASIYLSSMSLFEMGDSTGQVSLEALFDENRPLDAIPVWDPELQDIIRFCVRGGWPSSLGCDLIQQKAIPRQYLEQCINADILTSGLAKNKRNPRKIEAMFAAIAEYEHSANLIADVTTHLEEKGEKFSRNTVASYVDLMEMMYLIKEQPAFIPDVQTSRIVRKTSKFRLIDPSLVVASLRKEPEALIRDMRTLENVFDNLCIHELEVYADALDAKVFHYRDNYGGVADSIVELKDGRWGAFMHSLTVEGNDEAAAELIKIGRAYQGVDYAPSCLCILSGMEPIAYTREDGVKVVPITALKP